MPIKQFEIRIADLNPQMGIEHGKTRPVIVIQTNLLNKTPHPTTIVCPVTTNVKKGSEIVRVHLKKGTANLQQACDVTVDQIRVIDNKRLTKRVGLLPDELIELAQENIRIVSDLEKCTTLQLAAKANKGLGGMQRLVARFKF
ncbi:MAG TPA: type II toxin-antitoxin system PemK/MazF family toxin [Cytophagales bacterium]|jgi:mRNA interferase MazF|nr:type II toxin-antitoxin system PemK/MazF family toxin [Cytophagales bacterium]